MNLLTLIARLVFGGLYTYAGAIKTIDPQGFAQSVANYRILPEVLVNPVALWLPMVEVAAGLCLILGPLALGAAALLNGLMIVFMAALGYNWHRGLDVACGCFSTAAEKSDPAMLMLRDTGILLLGLLALVGVVRKHASRRR